MREGKKEYLGIQINEQEPSWLSDCGKALLSDGYLKDGETVSEALARASTAYCYGDYALAQRIYNYAYDNWFMFATPVLSNAPAGKWEELPDKNGAHYWHNVEFKGDKIRGLPISCYAFEIPDNLQGQTDTMTELAELSYRGGGTGGHLSIRAPSKKAPGAIPYMKVLDSVIGYYRQQGRRGSLAVYMDVNHPSIAEHIRFRMPNGDAKMRSDNRQQFHNAVNLTDEFIDAVLNDKEYDLVCPHSKQVFETVKARDVWQDIIETRALTGEPYMLKIDQVNRLMPETQKQRGLKIRGSNLCSEIVLPTDDQRTFVCCLSSLNIEKYDEWKDTNLVRDLTRFLDNVLQFFIDNAPDSLGKAKYSATQERAIGIGAMGYHSYFQSKGIPLESGGFNSAVQHTDKIFKYIKSEALKESKQLAIERGEAPDMLGTGLRGSRLLAIAPNASSGKIANTSPSCEPWYRNIYTQDTRVGAFVVKNPHLQKRLQELGMDTDEVWDAIKKADGSVQNIEGLSEHDKLVFRTAMEIDQHWLVELADVRGKYVCQAQSLNLFFPSGSLRKYVNSVHMKFLKSENVHTLYYFRTERESKVDTVKVIERQALVDWSGGECKSCEG
jgi:ribonucleoside-diphosphate reductase alpha chain